MPSSPRIVLDPGHGGTQSLGGSSPLGCRGPSGTLEKDVTLALAQRVATHLGGDVSLTRTGDSSLSLVERTKVAQSAPASGVFLSIHANSGPVGTRGAETFVHTGADGRSAALGERLQRNMVRLGGPDRGLKAADFGVLRPDRLAAGTAACLVEVDFLSDPGGERRLTDSRELDALGRALADGVREYLASTAATYGTPLALFERYRAFGRAATAEAQRTVMPRYDARSTSDATALWREWLARNERFSVGVDDTTFFPHSSICKLRVTLSNGRTLAGTGFFIAPNRLLTAAHMVVKPGGVSATSIEVLPGMTNDRSTFGSFTVAGAGQFRPHPSYVHDRPEHDLAVVVLRDDQRPPHGQVFPLAELRESPEGGIIVCGYAAEEVSSSRQHLDVDTLRGLQPESFTYALQTRRGTSGSPVFCSVGGDIQVVGVHSGSLPSTHPDHDHENTGCRLTEEKLRWLRSI